MEEKPMYGNAPHNTRKNGAHCNVYGHIYLRVIDRENEEDWSLTWCDHGISLAEAVCIREQLDHAISFASGIMSGRLPGGGEKI